MSISRFAQLPRLARYFNRDASNLLKPIVPQAAELPETETKQFRHLKSDFLKVATVTEDNFEEVVKFSAENTIDREALHAGASVTLQEFMSYFPRVLSEIIPEGLCYAVYDTRNDNLAGVICSEVHYPGKDYGFSGILNWCSDKKMRSIISAVSSVSNEDFFTQFQTDSLLRLHFGRIKPEYDRMGIINQLMHDSMEEGEKRGAGLAIGEVTNWRLAALMDKMGFKRIKVHKYEDMLDNGKQVFDLSKMNGSEGIVLMIKEF